MAAEVLRVGLRVNPEIDGLVGQPPSEKAHPGTGPAAQFSLPFTVATALLRGGFGLEDSQPAALVDEQVLDLAGRITVAADPQLRMSSVLGRTCMDVYLRDGQSFCFECDLPSGSPHSPASTEGLYRKFQDCLAFSGLGFEAGRADRLFERVQRLESLPTASSLIDDFTCT